MSLLTDYVLTVAVSTAAGTAALISAFPVFKPYAVPLALFFIGVIAFMNLKGVKESGKIFAVPTYFFIVIMGVMLIFGIVKLIGGNLGTIDPVHGMIKASKQGSAADGLFYGPGLAAMLHAFAVERHRRHRRRGDLERRDRVQEARMAERPATLVIMGSVLGTLFLGLSFLASHVHPVPFESGYPTVISEVGKQVFGTSPPAPCCSSRCRPGPC